MKLSKPLVYLSFFILASCQQHNTQNKNLETSVENNEIQEDNAFCSAHHQDCRKFAMELNMSLDEYHKFYKEQQDAIAQEDEMTDANGDIVDPNASARETQKQWVNCKNCHGNGTNECWVCKGAGNEKCNRCDGKGTIKYWRQDGNGTYLETCDNCGGRGNNNCTNCNGKGTDGNCRRCNGRGQVLVSY